MNTHQYKHEPFANSQRIQPFTSPGAAVACSADAVIDALELRDEIRHRAFHKWQGAGQPTGDGVHFWLQAEQEVAAERHDKSISRDDWCAGKLANDGVLFDGEQAAAATGAVGFDDSQVSAVPGAYADDGALQTQAAEENAKALNASVDSHYRDNNRMFQRHGDRGHRHGINND